jgi:hypothetical protein
MNPTPLLTPILVLVAASALAQFEFEGRTETVPRAAEPSAQAALDLYQSCIEQGLLIEQKRLGETTEAESVRSASESAASAKDYCANHRAALDKYLGPEARAAITRDTDARLAAALADAEESKPQ